MTFTTIGRWTLAFWLEALLVAGVLMLFGWMQTGFSQMVFFGLAASMLLLAGSWLYQGGSRHFLFHLLLYPIVAGVGMLSYFVFDSWIVAVLLAGLFFWRIHSVASDGLGHASLQRRFVLALMTSLIQLVIAALYDSVVHPERFDSGSYFGMLVLILASYLLLSWSEFVTRERLVHARPSARLTAVIGGQLLGTRIAIAAGYLLAASSLLFLLHSIWSWVKGPLGSGLYLLLTPVLELLAEWMEGLSGVLEKDRRVNQLLDNQGQGGEQPYEQTEVGESLFSLLEPYLIAAVVLIFLLLLGRFMWKRRYRADHEPGQEVTSAHSATWSPVDSSDSDQDRPLQDLRRWFKKPPGPHDDPVRYAYYQFLQYMSSQGMGIHRFETSHEYLRRLRRQWHDAGQLDLASQITDCYEQYRYQEQSLSANEIAAMQDAVRKLRESKT